MKITYKKQLYYNTKELAELLGVTRRHARRLADKNELQYVVVERWRLYPVKEADDFIAQYRR